MKKIYTVTLDDEVPLSPELLDGIKVLCYLLYDEITGLEYDSNVKILDHDGIVYNELLEKEQNGDYVHRFTYNDIESGKYEPFMINDTSFAFTVNDGTITDSEVNELIHQVRIYSKIRCNFKIDSVIYREDAKGKNRLLAIKKILLESKKEDKHAKLRVKSILPIIGFNLR